MLADKARADGDPAKAQQYEQTAQSLANQLVSSEQSVQDLKQLHDQALGAATQAREAVQNNSTMLEQKLAERSKLLSQLEQAKMQEQVAASLNQISGMAAPGNTPSLEQVRDKIEQRYATALGQADLASNSTQGRMMEIRKATTDMAGSARLEEIRAQLHGDSAPAVGSGQQPAAVEAGQPAVDGVAQQSSQAQPQQTTPPTP